MRRRRRTRARKPREFKPIINTDFKSLSRPDTTSLLSEMAQRYLISKGFSCHPEITLTKVGRQSLRADIFALNFKGETRLIEIKSSWHDFSTDTKWTKYKLYADQMFFCISEHLYETHGAKIWEQVKEHGAGILVVENNGHTKIKHRAKPFAVNNIISRRLLKRCAWRGGRFQI